MLLLRERSWKLFCRILKTLGMVEEQRGMSDASFLSIITVCEARCTFARAGGPTGFPFAASASRVGV